MAAQLSIRFILLGLVLITVAPVWGQIDPVKRRLIQLGYNQPLEGKGPIAGYAYYYHNQPNFLHTNLTLRLAVAPIYLDAELGVRNFLGPHSDLGLGIGGGGFADSYSEIRQGRFLEEESFTGHGGEASASLYQLLNPGARIPLTAILRGGFSHSFYERDSDTDPAFALPDDQSRLFFRSGLRWGGIEPTVNADLAMELSAWYEGQIRSDPGRYGFARDRALEQDAHLFWARALGVYTFEEIPHKISLSLTAGTSLGTDRFSAYRLGGFLPLGAEFPLNLPGYYYQELTARKFFLVQSRYMFPLDTANHWFITALASTALVDYLSGLEQDGSWHSGVGGGITYQTPSRALNVTLGYSYGFNAIRSHGRGANSIGLVFQYDLDAHLRAKERPSAPSVQPNKLRGFDWLFGR